VRAKYFSLEGLRGVLALLVCCGHLGLTTLTQRFGFAVRFGLAVDVFFALSGFVLCHTSYFGRRTWREFAVGRIARLYPLHALTAIAVLAMAPARGVGVTTFEVAQQLTLTHNVGLPPNRFALNFPAWSISVEFWIALLFFALMSSRRWRWPWLLLIAVSLPIAFPDLTQGEAQNVLGVANLGLLRGIAAFSVGALAYLAYEHYGHRLSLPTAVPYALLAALVGLLTLPSWSVPATLAFYGLMFTLLVTLAANDGATILHSRALVWLGTVSYSVYMLHMPIYFALQLAVGDSVLRGAGKPFVIANVLAAAYLSHRWVEVPCQRVIREALVGRGTRVAAATGSG
jgi:peptidoglycan/LPS O-acetylase OafA/YrhL